MRDFRSAPLGRTGLPPVWDLIVLPGLNLALALAMALPLMALLGQHPWALLQSVLFNALGTGAGLCASLHHATSFAFTGLAVAVALHGGLLNLGGEGQAMAAAAGTTVVALTLGAALPPWLLLPLMVLAAMACGLIWAAVPAALLAWRGTPVALSSLLASFVAPALLVGLSEGPEGAAAPWPEQAWMPTLHGAMALLGIPWPATALNLSALLALGAALALWALLGRHRAGYELRASGLAPAAAQHAGIAAERHWARALLLSGALAGLAAVNVLAGANHRLTSDAVGGAGAVGVVVALAARGHPLGVGVAALLAGALWQGHAMMDVADLGPPAGTVVLVIGLVALTTGPLATAPVSALLALQQAMGPMRLRREARDDD